MFWNTSEAMNVCPFVATYYYSCWEVPTFMTPCQKLSQSIPTIWAWSVALDVGRCLKRPLRSATCTQQVFWNNCEAMVVCPDFGTHQYLCWEVSTWLALAKNGVNWFPSFGHRVVPWMLKDARGSFSHQVVWNTSEAIDMPPCVVTHPDPCQIGTTWLALVKKQVNQFYHTAIQP